MTGTAPAADTAGTGEAPTAFLDVRDLKIHFPTDDGLVKSVDGLSFQLERGRTLGIVGESGSGKSVTSLGVLGLHNKRNANVSGEIWLNGKELVNASQAEVRRLRGRDMAMIFQDPLSSMHPFYTIGAQIIEAYRCTTTCPSRWRASTPSTCSAASASPSRTSGSTTTRTSSPAACGSAR